MGLPADRTVTVTDKFKSARDFVRDGATKTTPLYGHASISVRRVDRSRTGNDTCDRPFREQRTLERIKIDGSCHCGEITYEADINPDYVVICHCTDCQNISGAPYRANVPVLPENFTLRGTPKTYMKTADSGNKIVHAFCGNCGSALYSHRAVETPRSFILR